MASARAESGAAAASRTLAGVADAGQAVATDRRTARGERRQRRMSRNIATGHRTLWGAAFKGDGLVTFPG